MTGLAEDVVAQRRDALTLLSVSDATASGGFALQIASLQRSVSPGSAGTCAYARAVGLQQRVVAINGTTLGTLVSARSC